MILLLTLLTIKHFIFDFLYQPPYQWMNKGTYGHWGGLIHSGQHAVATFIILVCLGIQLYPPVEWFNPQPCNLCILLLIALVEFIIHYHMDWFKMWFGKKLNFKPHPSMGCSVKEAECFWYLMGFDQFVHAMTYIGIVAYIYGI